nr:nucleotidyltransferase domain-containing protein [Jiangella gansuensis]
MEEQVAAMARVLCDVDGVVGVALGGSRARGTHRPDSDYDLGLYYRGRLDTSAVGDLARRFGGPGTRVTEPGEWGPWVDGGGWLTVDGVAVDWLYRDADRVAASIASAERGEYAFHQQAGHPLGVPDFAYAGELALAVLLADPSGELAAQAVAPGRTRSRCGRRCAGDCGRRRSRSRSPRRPHSGPTPRTSPAACSALSGSARTPCTVMTGAG